MKPIFHIAKLIGKLLQGTITPDEKALIDNWLSESPENYQLYQKLTNAEYLEDDLQELKTISAKAAWTNINRKINRGDNKPVLKKYAVFKYAAILIPFLLTFVVWMYVKVNPKPQVVKDKTQLAKQTPQIHPGSKQAILELSDGRKLVLGKNADQTIEEGNGAKLLNSEHVLTYNNASQSNNAKPVYNKVIIPRGGEYQLVLEDGTKVWLNSSSSLYYPVQFTGVTS